MDSVNEKFIDFLNSIVGREPEKLITQAELAEKINCTAVSLNRYLSKNREMPVEALFKIKKVLNISDKMFMSFYCDFSTDEFSNEKYSELCAKYLNLNDENKIKLLDYIDYLIFQQSNYSVQEKKLDKNI